MLCSVAAGTVGRHERFTSPFGEKAVVYADWTASGRPLASVEAYLAGHVLPFYGNTHTATSVTGHQTTCFRDEARQIVAQAVNAKVTGKAAEDVVLFTGNGTTSAVHKLVQSLGLHLPAVGSSSGSDGIARPVVFTSSYEHHSNLLPWRESVAEVVTIKYSPATGVCLEDLAEQLTKFGSRKALKIGTFSAASNVTGVLTAVDKVSTLLHSHGALAFFDYATAAPYTVIDMNPALEPLAYKDAIFFSGHKFVGGPGAPGVLIAKRNILTPRDATPTVPGGGTVFYVTEEHHRYLSNREEREEGGTPNILGDVKLGLVVHLKQTVGQAWIQEEELRISAYGQAKLEKDAGASIVLLGRTPISDAASAACASSSHLPIFSFLVRVGSRFLHHNFVCALLNDLFGIQSRGGCQCAGPFSQQLLGLTAQANAELEASLLEKHEVLRPGYSRFSLPYWVPQHEHDYVLDAVVFVALHGAKFLPLYRYNHRTGEWAHSTRLTRFPERKWISHFDITSNLAGTTAAATTAAGDAKLFDDLMQSAKAELAKIDKNKSFRGGSGAVASDNDDSTHAGAELGGAWAGLRWFVLPGDDTNGISGPPVGPIQPRTGAEIALQQKQIAAAAAASGNALGDGSTHLSQALHGASAYAQHRAEKFPAHQGGSQAVPRYVQLADVADGEPPTSQHLPLRATKPLAAAATAAAAAVPPPLPTVAHAMQNSTAGNCLMGACSTAPVPPLLPGQATLPAFLASKPITPPKKIMKLVGQCVREWNMIEEGDRLCLGLSGGKDSLSLLHVLIALQKRAPVRFTISCATVDPQTASFDPSPLIPYLQSLGITYHYLSHPIVEMAASRLQGDSLCAFCARFKRGLLYSCCRDNGYNKLLLAQHLDDFAESFLMSALHNGQMRTMKANYKIDAGDLTVIRPFAYVREQQTRQFAVDAKLPIINENCPACFEQPKERARVKQLLLQEETMVPALYFNLRRALLPLMADEAYSAMASISDRIAAAGLSRSNAHPSSRSNKGKEGQPMRVTTAELGPSDEAQEHGGSPAKRARGEPPVCGPQGCPVDYDELFA